MDGKKKNAVSDKRRADSEKTQKHQWMFLKLYYEVVIYVTSKKIFRGCKHTPYNPISDLKTSQFRLVK